MGFSRYLQPKAPLTFTWECQLIPWTFSSSLGKEGVKQAWPVLVLPILGSKPPPPEGAVIDHSLATFLLCRPMQLALQDVGPVCRLLLLTFPGYMLSISGQGPMSSLFLISRHTTQRMNQPFLALASPQLCGLG